MSFVIPSTERLVPGFYFEGEKGICSPSPREKLLPWLQGFIKGEGGGTFGLFVTFSKRNPEHIEKHFNP